jgi:hypothetical protein
LVPLQLVNNAKKFVHHCGLLLVTGCRSTSVNGKGRRKLLISVLFLT